MTSVMAPRTASISIWPGFPGSNLAMRRWKEALSQLVQSEANVSKVFLVAPLRREKASPSPPSSPGPDASKASCLRSDSAVRPPESCACCPCAAPARRLLVLAASLCLLFSGFDAPLWPLDQRKPFLRFLERTRSLPIALEESCSSQKNVFFGS